MKASLRGSPHGPSPPTSPPDEGPAEVQPGGAMCPGPRDGQGTRDQLSVLKLKTLPWRSVALNT